MSAERNEHGNKVKEAEERRDMNDRKVAEGGGVWNVRSTDIAAAKARFKSGEDGHDDVAVEGPEIAKSESDN